MTEPVTPRAWAPSKFVLARGGVRPHPRVPGSSRLVTTLVGEFYRDAIPQHARGAVADLGCGSAPLFALYGRYADTAMWFDWPNSLHANAALDAACDLNVGVPVRSGVFDTVIVSDVLEHLRRPAVAWCEIMRVLRPGGVVLGNVPFMYWVHEAPYDYHRYTEYALRAAIDDAGGEVVELIALGGSVDVLADLVGKHVGRVPMVGQPLVGAIAWVALAFGRTRLGTRLRVATNRAFPLGYAFVARRSAAEASPARDVSEAGASSGLRSVTRA